MMGPDTAEDVWIELVAGAVILSMGASLAWFGPRAKGTVQPGYLLMIVGIGLMFMGLWEAGIFGYSKLLAFIPAAISIGLSLIWLRHRRR
jgi:hypothetical protein